MGFLGDGVIAAGNLILSGDPELLSIASVSLSVSLTATFIAACLGIPAGFLIAFRSFPGKRALVSILNTTLALPTVVIGLFVYALISRHGVLGSLGLLYTRKAIVIGQIILILPVVTTFVLSAVSRIDARYHKTALTLGAGEFQAALLILREARFGVVAAIALAFGRVIAEVGISMMLGGNIKGFTRTMTTALALEYDKGDFALSMALGIVLVTISFAVNSLFVLFQGRARA